MAELAIWLQLLHVRLLTYQPTAPSTRKIWMCCRSRFCLSHFGKTKELTRAEIPSQLPPLKNGATAGFESSEILLSSFPRKERKEKKKKKMETVEQKKKKTFRLI